MTSAIERSNQSRSAAFVAVSSSAGGTHGRSAGAQSRSCSSTERSRSAEASGTCSSGVTCGWTASRSNVKAPSFESRAGELGITKVSSSPTIVPSEGSPSSPSMTKSRSSIPILPPRMTGVWLSWAGVASTFVPPSQSAKILFCAVPQLAVSALHCCTSCAASSGESPTMVCLIGLSGCWLASRPRSAPTFATALAYTKAAPGAWLRITSSARRSICVADCSAGTHGAEQLEAVSTWPNTRAASSGSSHGASS